LGLTYQSSFMLGLPARLARSLMRAPSLVPAPRVHLVRYLGVLAPAAKWRSSIIPSATDANETMPECRHALTGQPEKHRRPRNYSWAEFRKV
jgi:hypothetical protein